VLLSLSGFLFEDGRRSQSVTFDEFCAIAERAGYDGVELRRTQVNVDTPKANRKELMTIVRDAGLTVTCLTAKGLGGSGDERDAFLVRYRDLCQDMECGLLKIAGDPSWLRPAAVRAKEYGVTLATNNHISGRLETVQGTREYFAELGDAPFGLLYDSLHLYVSGQDYLGCIDEFFGVTRNILVHSVRPVREGEQVFVEKDDRRWAVALPNEQGVQNWRGILDNFKRLGYDGPITAIESGWPVDRREQVACEVARYIKQLWEDVG